MLEAVSRPRIRELVARKLTGSLARQGLKPGDWLPDNNELAGLTGQVVVVATC